MEKQIILKPTLVALAVNYLYGGSYVRNIVMTDKQYKDMQRTWALHPLRSLLFKHQMDAFRVAYMQLDQCKAITDGRFANGQIIQHKGGIGFGSGWGQNPHLLPELEHIFRRRIDTDTIVIDSVPESMKQQLFISGRQIGKTTSATTTATTMARHLAKQHKLLTAYTPRNLQFVKKEMT